MIKIIFLLISLVSCSSNNDGVVFLDILENRYANIEVNKEHKLLVINKIKSFVKEGKFTEDNIEELKSLLLQMKDYHLVMNSTQESEVMEEVKETECISSKVTSNNTFYIKVHSLWCENEKISSIDRFKSEFKEAALKAKKYKNITIDLRGNGGGGDQETRYLLQRLIKDKSFLYQYQYLNSNLPFYKRSIGRWGEKKIDYIEPTKEDVDYLGDKIITALIDKNTFSSAEVVASVLKFSKSAKVIGERTKGGAGDPVEKLFFNGRYKLIYPTCIVWQEDGSLYEQNGVTPNL